MGPIRRGATVTSTVIHALHRKRSPFRVAVLDDGSGETNAPCAAIFGEPGDGCLVRVQSRCLYGEIFESTNCDCRYQLRASLRKLRRNEGVLVYLDQEGRGAGLLTKAKGYQLCQESDINTFAAYAKLEREPDSRSYELAAALLKQLGLAEVTLLTNNPAKVGGLEACGLKVRQQSLVIPKATDQMYGYLMAKIQHQRHMISASASFWWRLKRSSPSDSLLGGAIPLFVQYLQRYVQAELRFFGEACQSILLAGVAVIEAARTPAGGNLPTADRTYEEPLALEIPGHSDRLPSVQSVAGIPAEPLALG